MNTIFGPINSRRFGSSLGIDLSPATKQCNFDCLYCELAPSTSVDHQSNVVSVQKIVDELKAHLNTKIDVITITANGEQTLYPYLNDLVDAIDKIKHKTQTLILTNSATLVDENIFNILLKLDQVKLSLDAVSDTIFKKIDRPHEGINISEIIKKVIEFSRVFKGELFIEILFVKGVNNTAEEIKKLNDVLLQLDVSRVDIGTIDRPPAYFVEPIHYKQLHKISLLFDSSIPINITSRVTSKAIKAYYTNEDILNTLDKRPLTMDDISLLFDDDTQARVEVLLQEKKIVKKSIGNLEFLILSQNIKRKR